MVRLQWQNLECGRAFTNPLTVRIPDLSRRNAIVPSTNRVLERVLSDSMTDSDMHSRAPIAYATLVVSPLGMSASKPT